LDLSERLNRLLVRLELGVPSSIVELATQLGNRLTRGDYLRLIRSGLANVETLKSVDDQTILPCVGNDSDKLEHIRLAIIRVDMKNKIEVPSPILPEYQQ
jgi:helicase